MREPFQAFTAHYARLKFLKLGRQVILNSRRVEILQQQDCSLVERSIAFPKCVANGVI